MCGSTGLGPAKHWSPSRPIIVRHNDYRAELFNGDIGICLADKAGRLRVWFRTTDGLRATIGRRVHRHSGLAERLRD